MTLSRKVFLESATGAELSIELLRPHTYAHGVYQCADWAGVGEVVLNDERGLVLRHPTTLRYVEALLDERMGEVIAQLEG